MPQKEKATRISYSAQLPQRIMPCESNCAAINNFLFGVAGARLNVEGKEDRNESGKSVVLYDSTRSFTKYKFILDCGEGGRNCSIRKRNVLMHTILHGSISASVLDLICPNCATIPFFDGRDSAMFLGLLQQCLLVTSLTSGCIMSLCWENFPSCI